MKKEVSRTEKVLNVWAIVLILWSVYRAYFRTEFPIWVDELVAKPLVFLLPVYLYIRNKEKGSFFELVDFRLRNIKGDLALGLLVGVIFFAAGASGAYLRAGVRVFNNISFDSALLFTVLLAFATAFSEEILSRGFVLKRLYEESKNVFTSSFLASVLFFLLHVPILFTSPNMSGLLLLQVMVTDVLLSIAVSFLYLERKSVILPIIVHALYTLSLYLFI